jgi:DNA-binding IclR family transcriptional regulator
MLAQIRRDGVVVSDRQVTVDAVSVAAPIFDAAGAVLAALSIVSKADGTDAAGLVPAVRAAALGTSRALRARRPPP